MEKIDLDKYDIITEMEDIIENITSIFSLGNKSLIINPKIEQQTIYIITIVSILYKQKCFEEYLEKITKSNRRDYIETLEELIKKITESLNKNGILPTTILIQKKGLIIQEYIDLYFEKKNTNYITRKHQIELVIEQNNQKEILKYNPLIINQLLKEIHQPLTKEEMIIGNILDFIIEAQQEYIDKIEIVKNIKKLIKNKYNQNQEEVISFIISNVYQELKENQLDENANKIIPIIENTKIDREYIIKEFIENDKFSNMIIKSFQKYNMNIKEGHLEYLENQPSRQYAKRIYKK